MVVLHICYINNNKASGISNVVPEHFKNQKKYNKNIGLLNCNDLVIEQLKEEENVFNIKDLKKNDITISLTKPFNNPNLVVFHDVYIPVYIKIAKILIKKNIPYIIIPHGSLSLYAQKTKYLKKKIANIMLFNKFIYNSLSIQFLSEEEQRMSSKFMHNSFVLGNGISSINQTKRDFNKDKINMIYVGRYSIHNKGIDILLESCLKCKSFMLKNNIYLDMFGANTRSGDGFKYIDDYIREHNLEKVVRVFGPIYDEEKYFQLRSHDIFIQTSRSEGQPLGIMEAMMIGLPIIASEGTTFSKLIECNSCGYRFLDSDHFQQLLVKMLHDKDSFQKMSVNSIEFAQKNFLWSDIAKKTLDIYYRLLNRGENNIEKK